MYRPSTRMASVAIFCALACIVLLRVPEVTYPGRFLAEEGTIYFREAYAHAPARVFLTANLGYYSLYNKIAAVAAAHSVPLEHAPVVTGVFAFVAQMIPFALILFSAFEGLSSTWRKAIACLLVLLVQPNQEVWLNTINSQFFFCVSCGLILVSRATSTRWHVFRLCILAMAGLTGVVSCLLLPLFVVSYGRSRSSQRLHETIVLGVATAIQAMVVLTTEGRETQMYPAVLPFVLLVKQWIFPLLGGQIANAFSEIVKHRALYQNPGLAGLALLPHGIVGLALLVGGRKEAVLLLCASVGIAGISFMQSVDARHLDLILSHISAAGAGRYYYAPNVFLALAISMSPRKPSFCGARFGRAYNIASCALVGMFLVVGARDYVLSKRHRWVFSGPCWTEQARNWQAGRTDRLLIWPQGWQMTLPRMGAEQPNLPDPDNPE